MKQIPTQIFFSITTLLPKTITFMCNKTKLYTYKTYMQ